MIFKQLEKEPSLSPKPTHLKEEPITEKAVVYARFSSDKQTEDSIEAQLRACREYAARHDMEIVEVYADEAVSGKGSKTAKRKQYQRMLRDCEKGQFSVILIHKYDRIARNLGEHVNLEARLEALDVRLIAVAQDFGNSKEAKIMRALMYSLSEYYIDNLAEEIRKGLKETALKAKHTGGYAPFGYDIVDQKYVINPFEAVYVHKIFDAASHRQGFTALIQEMAEAGVTGKRGKPIKYPQIYEILRNEKYTGVYIYSPVMEKTREGRREKPNAIRIENALPAIIDKAQFEEVQEIMSEKKQVGKRAGHLCSGLVYCQCGAKMHASRSTKRNFSKLYYRCPGKCGARMVPMEDVDDAAKKYLKNLLTEKNQRKIADALRRYQAGEGSRMEEFKAALKERIAQKEEQYDALLDNLAAGSLPPEVVADIGQRMQQVKAEIAALEATEPPKDFTVETIQNWLNAIKAAPDEEGVHLLVERIEVTTDKEKTDFNLQSTLKSVLGKHGRGDGI